MARFIRIAMVGLVSIASGPAGILVPTAPASAQEDGESRCGADEHVERYDAVARHWSWQMSECAQGAPTRSDDGDHARRSDDEPQEGDTKCGADGKVYTYYRGLHSWEGGIEDCK